MQVGEKQVCRISSLLPLCSGLSPLVRGGGVSPLLSVIGCPLTHYQFSREREVGMYYIGSLLARLQVGRAVVLHLAAPYLKDSLSPKGMAFSPVTTLFPYPHRSKCSNGFLLLPISGYFNIPSWFFWFFSHLSKVCLYPSLRYLKSSELDSISSSILTDTDMIL